MKTKTTRTPADEGIAAARRDAHVDDMLRAKLMHIRDLAMELSAVMEFAKPGGVAADPVWKFAQIVIEEAEALLPIAHKSGGIPERGELLDELQNSLEARCESCCKGLPHDEEHCGAPTARRMLVAAGRIKA
jgi:hypothetical protein